MLQYTLSAIDENTVTLLCTFDTFEDALAQFFDDRGQINPRFEQLTNILYRGASGIYYLIQEVCPESGC